MRGAITALHALKRPLKELRLIRFIHDISSEQRYLVRGMLADGKVALLNILAIRHKDTPPGIDLGLRFWESVCEADDPYISPDSIWQCFRFVYDHAAVERGASARLVPESTWQIHLPQYVS